jgi:uncharacterized membrane protein YfcA
VSYLTYSYPVTLAIICPLIFLAGFVDSIAGGGGIIAVPAYMFAGIPIHMTYGSNKFAMSLGTAISVVNYVRERKVVLGVAIAGIIGALPGSFFGTKLALYLPQTVLKVILMAALPVMALLLTLNQSGVFLRKKVRRQSSKVKVTGAAEEPLSVRKARLVGFLVGLTVGCYDGFFGPGAGMFYTLAMAGLVRLELVKAAGTTKALNLASNVASAATYLVYGKVLFPLAIPAMVCAMLGNYFGSRLAIKIGARFIRPVILLVIVLLFVKVISDWV